MLFSFASTGVLRRPRKHAVQQIESSASTQEGRQANQVGVQAASSLIEDDSVPLSSIIDRTHFVACSVCLPALVLLLRVL